MEQAVAAPMCTRVLADFGARVIKVENPNGGDFARDYDDVVNGPGGLAAHFVWCNRGKESVTLNMKSPAGMDLLHRLLDRADAFVSNLAPGATARMGIAPADLAAAPPRTSSLSRSTATDPAGRSRTSARMTFWCRRSRARAPSPAIPACPPSRGPRWPTSPPGCTRRSRSWRCCSRAAAVPRGPRRPSVELSLFDVMTDVMGYALTYTQHSGIDQQPLGVGSPAVAPYGAFPHPRRSDRRARHHQRPGMAAGGQGDHRPPRPRRRPAVRAPTPAAARTATSSTRPSDPGVPNTISRTSRRPPTPPASATRATTCPARWWCIRS